MKLDLEGLVVKLFQELYEKEKVPKCLTVIHEGIEVLIFKNKQSETIYQAFVWLNKRGVFVSGKPNPKAGDNRVPYVRTSLSELIYVLSQIETEELTTV